MAYLVLMCVLITIGLLAVWLVYRRPLRTEQDSVTDFRRSMTALAPRTLRRRR